MKKATGIISFIGVLIISILLIYSFFDERIYKHDEEFLVYTGYFILCISIIHYLIATKFWTSRLSVLESLDRENEIIKKKIEKRELIAKLEKLERNDK